MDRHVTLSEIFHPVSAADFLTEYFHSAPLHAPGPATRFASLSAAAEASLTQNLELDLEAPVRIVADTGWNGHAFHRCERDLIVLQATGRDLWRIHGRAAEQTPESTWEWQVNEGGALYIPRGCWCSAEPHAPSQNLMLHIENPTGADLLFWLAEKMKQNEAFAGDIPRFAGPAAKSAYLVAMRHAIVQAFRRPDLLERFSRRLNSDAPLPAEPVTPFTAAESLRRWITLTAPRRPTIRRRDKDCIHIRAGGWDFPFPVDAAPLLQYLFEKAPLPTAEFYGEFEGEFDREEIDDFLAVLHKAGIIRLADADSPA